MMAMTALEGNNRLQKGKLRPPLHCTGSAWSRYQIEWFKDECSLQIYDHITEFNNN